MTSRTAGLTALAMCAFAANSLLCRAALGQGALDALSFTLVRLAAGAAVLALLAARSPLPPAGDHVWLRAGALWAYAIGFSLAYTRIPTAVGALVLFGAVQLTMIGRGLLAGEGLRPGEWLGLAVSLLGLVGLNAPGLSAPDPLGTLLMSAAGVAWGVYSLEGRRAGEPLRANASAFARGLALALACSAVVAIRVAPQVTPMGVGLALASGGLASGLGYAVWYAALKGLSAPQAAIVQLSVPPLAALAAVALLDEPLGLRLVASGAAILGGIALALGARRR